MLLILAQIQPVNPPLQLELFVLGQPDPHGLRSSMAEKDTSKPAGTKSPFFTLLCQSQMVRSVIPFHPAGQIGIAGRAFHNGIPILACHLLHTFPYQSLSLSLRNPFPVQLPALDRLKAQVNGLVEQISHIHCLQPVFLPLHKLQAEFQKMGIGTGSELLQPVTLPSRVLP